MLLRVAGVGSRWAAVPIMFYSFSTTLNPEPLKCCDPLSVRDREEMELCSDRTSRV